MRKNILPTFVGEGDLERPPMTVEEKEMVEEHERTIKKSLENDKVMPEGAGESVGQFQAYSDQGEVVAYGERYKRPLVPVSIWTRACAIKFVNSVRLGTKGDATFVTDQHYNIFLMTNRTVRVSDVSESFFIYVPMENVVYLQVDTNSLYERGFQAIVRASAKREEEARRLALADAENQLP